MRPWGNCPSLLAALIRDDHYITSGDQQGGRWKGGEKAIKNTQSLYKSVITWAHWLTDWPENEHGLSLRLSHEVISIFVPGFYKVPRQSRFSVCYFHRIPSECTNVAGLLLYLGSTRSLPPLPIQNPILLPKNTKSDSDEPVCVNREV